MSITTRTNIFPKYYQTKIDLINYILREALKIGDVIPTDRKLCEIFNVANLTVRRAIDELISEGILSKPFGQRARVISIPKPLANDDRGLAAAHRILIAGPRLSLKPGSHFAALASTIEQFCYASGDLPAITAAPDEQLESVLLQQTNVNAFHGVILLGNYSDQIPLALHRKGIPVVVLDYCPSAASITSVTTDNKKIALRSVQHLFEKGHRTIDFIGHFAGKGRDADAVEMEIEWRKLGLSMSFTGESVYLREKNWGNFPDFICIDEAVARMLNRESKPTALFVSNKHIAAAVRVSIEKLNIRIPQDISIITVTGTVEEEDFNITGATIDWFEMAKLCVFNLKGIITGDIRPGNRVSHSGDVVDRFTTAPVLVN